MNAMKVVDPDYNLYKHMKCNGISTMPSNMMADLRKDQDFYGVFPCSQCGGYHRVSEFVWVTGQPKQSVVIENTHLEGGK